MLEGLRKHAEDKKFQAKWKEVKLAKKERLADKIKVMKLLRTLSAVAHTGLHGVCTTHNHPACI